MTIICLTMLVVRSRVIKQIFAVSVAAQVDYVNNVEDSKQERLQDSF